MLKMQYAEIIRFQDLKTMPFEEEIAKMQHDNLSDNTETKQKRQFTIQTLKDAFQFQEITDLNQYYIQLENWRKDNIFYSCKDRIGFKSNIIEGIKNINLSNFETLDESLATCSKIERMCFYRNAPYIYNYTDENYQPILQLIIKYMRKDGLQREANIIEFEYHNNIIGKEYLDKVKRLKK
jgi:hypothetical protein